MDPWGTLMAVLVALSLSVPAALIYRHVHTRKGAVIGLVVGALLALVAAIAGNLVITPIYTGWPVSEVAAIIVPALLPFDLIKFVIHGVVTFLVYKPISNLLESLTLSGRSRRLGQPATEGHRTRLISDSPGDDLSGGLHPV